MLNGNEIKRLNKEETQQRLMLIFVINEFVPCNDGTFTAQFKVSHSSPFNGISRQSTLTDMTLQTD